MKKKIKLRDMTVEQWYNNKALLCELFGNGYCNDFIFQSIGGCEASYNKKLWFNNKDFYSNRFLDQTVEIEVPDTLNKEEKEYLSSVIKPFRNRIVDIKKVEFDDTNFIAITVVNAIHTLSKESINFPYFKKDEMYKNMKKNYSYTLEELGL